MIHMGYRYQSEIVVPDRCEPDPDEPENQPNSRPGARAPHAWLAPRRSTLDLFGESFRLLDFAPDDPDGAGETAGASLDGFVRAFGDRQVPLAVTVCRNSDVASLYRRRFVLVRPDGHVAWRDAELPADPRALVDVVRGAS
jgi:hypothetical protein